MIEAILFHIGQIIALGAATLVGVWLYRSMV